MSVKQPTTPEAIRSRIVGHGDADPATILAHPKNWRTHGPEQRAALIAELDRVGFVQSVVVNRTTGHLVDGHLRVEVAAERGVGTIPVVYVELSPEEEARVLVALDPLGSMAGTNDALLQDLLDGLDLENRALEQHLVTFLAGGRRGATEPDDVPPVPEGPEVWVQPGDVWLLGDHRLMCGDSTKAEDVARLMDGELAEGIFTSPPYAQQRDYAGNMASDWQVLMDGVFGAMLVEPSAQVFVNLGPVHRDGRVVRYWDGLIDWMEGHDWPLFGWYVWDKLNGMPGDWNGRLAPAHEFVFHFAASTQRPRKTVKTKGTTSRTSPHTQRRVDGSMKSFYSTGKIGQPTKIPDSVVRLTPQNGGFGDHPAPFPVALPSTFIEAYPLASWYEPFSGSGTTIIAAETLGRRCYAMELEPRYVQVAIERWQAFTGREATRG